LIQRILTTRTPYQALISARRRQLGGAVDNLAAVAIASQELY